MQMCCKTTEGRVYRTEGAPGAARPDGPAEGRPAPGDAAPDYGAAVLSRIGKRWQHPRTGAPRWYVNAWPLEVGLEVDKYPSGDVASVTWRGEAMPLEWYRKVERIKVWLDELGRVHVENCEAPEVEDAIVAAYTAMEARVFMEARL